MKRTFLQASFIIVSTILVGFFSAGIAVAQVVLSDDFSSGLSNWNTGTNTNQNPSGVADVTVVGERCVFNQDYDYIETKIDLSNNFEISFDVFNPNNSSPHDGAFWIQLLSSPDLGGVFRFRYGSDNRESINIVKPPAPTMLISEIGGIDDGSFLQDINNGSAPREGSLTLYCLDGKIKVAYIDEEGNHIETDLASISTFTSTKIRIWAHADMQLDNVIIKAPTAVPDTPCINDTKVVVIPLLGK